MKFLTIERIIKNGQPIQAIYERESLDIAKKEHYNVLAYNIGLDGIEKVSSAVMDENLNVLMKETWVAPEIPPNTQSE